MDVRYERADLLRKRDELSERIKQATALIAQMPSDGPELDAACARLTWATRELSRIDELLWGASADKADLIELIKIDELPVTTSMASQHSPLADADPTFSVCDPNFRPLIATYTRALNTSKVVCAVGLWKDLRIAYLSPGWFEFARANDGEMSVSQRWGVGDELLSGISGPLQSFFEDGYRRCLAERRPWEHSYECSSAEKYRYFHMISYPLVGGKGILTVHSARIERPFEVELAPITDNFNNYLSENGLLYQCSYCRRMRRNDCSEAWDRVTEWVQRAPANTSHVICDACFSFYYSRVEKGMSVDTPFFT